MAGRGLALEPGIDRGEEAAEVALAGEELADEFATCEASTSSGASSVFESAPRTADSIISKSPRPLRDQGSAKSV